MVSSEQQVIVISNDIVPGLGMPVAAPGLRAFGLAEGLRANGLKVKTIVAQRILERQWTSLGKNIPYPTAPDTEVVSAKNLSNYLESHAPATVILINSNQIDHLKPIQGIRYILDFFAPKMLEMVYQGGESYPKAGLQELRRRKIRAIHMADAFIVNGAKKIPYFLAWLLQCDRDVRHLPLEVVNMCAPLSFSEKCNGVGNGANTTRLAVAGYLHPWSRPGNSVQLLERYLDKPDVSLDLMLSEHWGKKKRPQEHNSDLERLRVHPAVTTHSPMTFSKFQKFLSEVDVSIDLFEHNLEREYAMVTRSITALAAGVPTVHPPFTEVSPMIDEYDAGWLVDQQDTKTLENTFDEIIYDTGVIGRKAENARALAADVLDPAVAVKPLLKIMESW